MKLCLFRTLLCQLCQAEKQKPFKSKIYILISHYSFIYFIKINRSTPDRVDCELMVHINMTGSVTNTVNFTSDFTRYFQLWCRAVTSVFLQYEHVWNDQIRCNKFPYIYFIQKQKTNKQKNSAKGPSKQDRGAGQTHLSFPPGDGALTPPGDVTLASPGHGASLPGTPWRRGTGAPGGPSEL